MRLYSFTNYYLSSLQKGLQTAHVVSQISAESAFFQISNPAPWKQYNEWAAQHKTIVILNGGNQASLNDIANIFDAGDNEYPWATFHEDEQSLNGCLTAVGIILPEKIYELAAKIRAREATVEYVEDIGYVSETFPEFLYTETDMKIIEVLNGCGLAI